jgi:hypothetical protein
VPGGERQTVLKKFVLSPTKFFFKVKKASNNLEFRVYFKFIEKPEKIHPRK